MTSDTGELSIQPPKEISSPPEGTVIPANPELKLRAPRTAKWELFLFFSTLGVYFAVYLFRLARDLRAITGKLLSPWLWIFVPFILLAQIIALPRLFELLRQAESENSIPDTWGGWSHLWVVLMCGTTLLFNISEKVSVPDWLIPVGIAIFCVLFVILHRRVNRIRLQYNGTASYTGKQNGFSRAEWVTTIFLFPIATAAMVLILFYSALLGGEVIEELDSGRVVHHEDHPFAISVPEDGWSLVEIGSHSDGTALLELEGPLVEMYYIVFYHGPGSSLDDVSSFRIEEAHSELSNADCSEQRLFLEEGLDISSRIQCEGTYLGDPNIVISKAVETENGIYELYGDFTTIEFTYKSNLETFLALEKGFGPR